MTQQMIELKCRCTPIREGQYYLVSEDDYWQNPVHKIDSIIQPRLSSSQKEKAVVVDIDGVMTHITPDGVLQKDGTYRKGIFDLLGSLNDLPKGETLKRLSAFHQQGYKIIFLTYRTEDQRIVTDKFLQGAVHYDYTLFMLPNSMALATAPQFKVWAIKELIMPYFDVHHFLDDDKATVDAVAAITPDMLEGTQKIHSHLIDRN